MVHGDPNTHRLYHWECGWRSYEKVRQVFQERGYTTVDALAAKYDEIRRVIVQEVQNDDTLKCFYLCYRAGGNGGVMVRHSSGYKYVSPHRMDVGLHAIGPEGLNFWDAVEECGYMKSEMLKWRYDN